MAQPASRLESAPPLPSLIGMNPDQLAHAVGQCGGRPFNGGQLAQWLYKRRVADLGAMSDLPKALRVTLAEKFSTITSQVIARQESGEGTTKLGLRLHDGLVIECVLMREHDTDDVSGPPDRLTICISTQAGCAMGCRFCASGRLGLKRHLSAGEILEQFFHVADLLRQEGAAQGRPESWLTNVVVMGMGEPLHNFDGLMGALEVVNAEWGFHFGARRVTVSTVGLPDRIRELAGQGYQFNLAVSLHATTDEQRTSLIPTNAGTGLKAIIAAAADYFRVSRREVTFEYTLVGESNDAPDDALRLAELLRDFPRGNVNLIPMNPVEGSGLKEPTAQAVEEFTRLLRQRGVNVHVRRKRGRRVLAACGQLRLQLESASGSPVSG
ncbi:MAG: 23S rRNA (adenine(2503)-C(2))-methyltransferase RlmN [Planctomycetes bacterium]|nr:23S rRNA (adenine(2503)-C(2))-methyltransferase RlmN [Planctomycetota bacterium]